MARTEYVDLQCKKEQKVLRGRSTIASFLLEVILVLNYGTVGGDDKRAGQ